MAKLFKQFEVWATNCLTKLRSDEFFIARIKLIFFYTFTTLIIIGGASILLYRSAIFNLADSINENIVDNRLAHIIFDHTSTILKDQFVVIDSLIIIVIVFLSIWLTHKTLRPIKINMEKQKRFIADASHELRTPVAVVISGLEVALRNKNLTLSDARRTLEETLIEMKEFSKLSNHLLDISKYDAKQKFIREPILIKNLISSVVKKMTHISSEKNITIESHIENDSIVMCDSTELGRVFFNILSNAVAYTPAGGLISVNGRTMSDRYVVVVKDNGEGIPKGILGKIFDPFFRGDESRTISGAGLGLTLVKKIIENHKGTISIKSEVGKGTSVTVSIPIKSQV